MAARGRHRFPAAGPGRASASPALTRTGNASIARAGLGSLARSCPMKIDFAKFALPRSGAVVVGAWDDWVLTPAARRLDEETGGALARAVAAAPRFHGKKNELLPLIGPPNVTLSRIVVAGLGKPDAVDARLLQDLGGNLVAHLNGAGESEATVAIDPGDGAPGMKPGEAAAQLAFGAALRAYRFDKYRTTEK